jgi:hypothetical protein
MMLEQVKREMEITLKAKTKKFYDNMRNVMMSHAQNLVEIEEVAQKD